MTCTIRATCTARPRLCKRRALVFKIPGKRRETGALVGRPRRRFGHKSADRDAEVGFYGRHVLARRVSRAGGQFEFRVVLLHLSQCLLPAYFEKRAESYLAPLSPLVSLPRAAARGGADASCDPYGARARARRPRGAILAVSGFQSTAPAARRGEKCGRLLELVKS